MLANTADYFRHHHDADVCAAVVYFDLEEGAKDLLAGSNMELFSVTKKHEFLPGLTDEYQTVFHQALEGPSSVQEVDPDLVDKVQQGLENATSPPENAIIDAFESYLSRHADELASGRLAVGSRTLTWGDVAQEMRHRTPFGRQYLEAITEGTIETLLG
jgi:hypothetical protein